MTVKISITKKEEKPPENRLLGCWMASRPPLPIPSLKDYPHVYFATAKRQSFHHLEWRYSSTWNETTVRPARPFDHFLHHTQPGIHPGASSGACGALILSCFLSLAELRWVLHHDVLNYWEAVRPLVWDQLSLVSLRVAVALDLFEAAELFTSCLSGSSFPSGQRRRSAEWQPHSLSSSTSVSPSLSLSSSLPLAFFLFCFCTSDASSTGQLICLKGQ